MIQHIVIEQGVTKIGASAFERCVNLTSITIPSSVNAIGMGVFGGCSSLTSVAIPSGVTRIGDVTFGNCVSLTSVIIPASVTSISDSAFNGCNGLKIYGTPGTYAESYANAKKYPFVAIGDEPGEKPAAPHIELRQSGRTVTNNAQLSVDYDVYYESTLNTIERLEIAWGFGGMQQDDYIAEVTDLVGVVAKVVHFYDPADDWFVMARVCSDGAWSAWSEKIWFKASEGGNVTWELSENGVLVISGNGKMDSYGQGKSPFCKNNNIHRIVIEQGVTSIGSFAFEGCKELTSVSIAGSVTQIGTNAFTGCIGLSSLTFPSSVAQIGKDAFYGCSSLSNLTIPGKISNISEGAFAFCTGLTNVTIQDGVKSIDTAAFYCCYNLSSVTIPNSVTRIQNNSFYQCNNLTIYGNSGSYAESYANANYYPFVAIGGQPCEHVWGKATVTVSPTETEKGIAKMVCSVCGQKTTVEIPALKDMRTLRLPTGLTTIEAEAFAGLNMQAIIIPNGCTTIGDKAFAGCASLIYVRVPAGTVIADNAFTDCGNVILDKVK